MSNFEINDHILDREAYSLAEEIFKEFQEEHGPGFDPEEWRNDMRDRAYEMADGHSWVIYTYKALMLCTHCDTATGDEYLEDAGGPTPADGIGDVATKVAFYELLYRIERDLEELIEDYDVPEGFEEDD